MNLRLVAASFIFRMPDAVQSLRQRTVWFSGAPRRLTRVPYKTPGDIRDMASRPRSSSVPPEHVRILGDALLPVLFVAEANHSVAEILHTVGLHAVALLSLWKVMRWAVDVDGGGPQLSGL